MRKSPNSSQPAENLAEPKTSYARSVPNAMRFRLAAGVEVFHLTALLCTMAALVAIFVEPSKEASLILIVAMVTSAASWLISFLMRRRVCCPLCKGTPLLNSGAATHIRAWRIKPLNNGVSSSLAIFFTKKFRCMYCGSDYDLLKPRSRGKR